MFKDNWGKAMEEDKLYAMGSCEVLGMMYLARICSCESAWKSCTHECSTFRLSINSCQREARFHGIMSLTEYEEYSLMAFRTREP